jgi:hypothetical protein
MWTQVAGSKTRAQPVLSVQYRHASYCVFFQKLHFLLTPAKSKKCYSCCWLAGKGYLGADEMWNVYSE